MPKPHQKNNVTSDDRHTMQKLGREYILTGVDAVLQLAAEYYVMAANVDEAASLFFWWEEGVRNYASSQYYIDKAHIALHERARYIGEDVA